MKSDLNNTKEYTDIPETIDVKHYICACCDLLGQSNSLSLWPSYTDELSPEAEETIAKSLRDAARFRLGLMNTVNGFLEQGCEPREYPATATPEQTELADKILSPLIHTQAFGDTVLIYAPAIVDELYQVKAVLGLLMSVGMMFRHSLTNGIPMRGGIDLGPGCQLFTNEIYGPVLAAAHHIESKIANYPRVVAGPGLINFIDMLINYNNSENKNLERVYRGTGHNMRQHLIADADGRLVVDYAGELYDEYLQSIPQDTSSQVPSVLDLKEFAQNMTKKYQHDDKLRGKYNQLLKYLERSRPKF
ncbi:MAG: hypothetical protein Phyf2KO_13180 [Phycisphaerales bacterium]